MKAHGWAITAILVMAVAPAVTRAEEPWTLRDVDSVGGAAPQQTGDDPPPVPPQEGGDERPPTPPQEEGDEKPPTPPQEGGDEKPPTPPQEGGDEKPPTPPQEGGNEKPPTPPQEGGDEKPIRAPEKAPKPATPPADEGPKPSAPPVDKAPKPADEPAAVPSQEGVDPGSPPPRQAAPDSPQEAGATEPVAPPTDMDASAPTPEVPATVVTEAPYEEPAEFTAEPPESGLEGAAAAPEAEDAPCNPEQQSCACDKNWGCFELIYMTKGAVLGVKATGTYVNEDGRDLPAVSFATTYLTERYATRDGLALHFAGAGTVGGGSAGTETAGSATVDFGWRGAVSKTSGPFLRVGMNGHWASNRRFRLALFEPLQGRVGYQVLEGDKVLEAGMTQGLVALGSYKPGGAVRKLSEAVELGGYLAVHTLPYRVNVSFTHLFPQATDSGSDLALGRASYCDYRLDVTLCAEVLYVRGEADRRGRIDRDDRPTQSLYSGFTIGFSP